MSDVSVQGQVHEVFADLFGLDGDGLTRDTSPSQIEAWDSMQHLNLVLSLEQTFGCRFSPDEIERMTSVGAIIDVVSESLG